MPRKTILLLFYAFIVSAGFAQISKTKIRTGADQTEKYFHFLNDKRVAVVANPTSQIAGVPLVDSLLHSGIRVVKVFGPEHGFRGNASAGVTVGDGYDSL